MGPEAGNKKKKEETPTREGKREEGEMFVLQRRRVTGECENECEELRWNCSGAKKEKDHFIGSGRELTLRQRNGQEENSGEVNSGRKPKGNPINLIDLKKKAWG